MRAAIVDAIRRAAPFPGADEVADAPGNIVDALLSCGVEPYLVLSACCAASGLPAARRAWLEGPLPAWPGGFDIALCRQVGACPVALRRGQWVVAYSDPEIAAAADSVGLPAHLRCLALPADLERFFAAAPATVNPFDQAVQTDAEGELIALQSQLDHVLNTDKVALPNASRTASADETIGDDEDDAADEDADDDDLDLYVDRLADQLTQPQVRPTIGAPPPSRGRPALDPVLPPARPGRPATMMSGPGSSLTSGSSPSLPSRSSPKRASPPTQLVRDASGTSGTSGTGGLKRRPPAAPTAPAPVSNRTLLLAAAVVCVVMAAIALPRLLKTPEKAAPAVVAVVDDKTGTLDFTAAQEGLLRRARAEPDMAAATRHLTECIRLDPTSKVARSALVERTRRAIAQGFLTQADNDLERLRRRPDADEIRTQIDGLALARSTAVSSTPSPTTPTSPAPPPTPSSPPAPPPAPPEAVLPGDGAAPATPDGVDPLLPR